MKEINEQLSNLIDNENIDQQSLDELIGNEEQQDIFARYHLMGDVLRNEKVMDIDICDQVMANIAQQPMLSVVPPTEKPQPSQVKNNVISFVKRFGQYGIAASFAAAVMMTSFMTSEPSVENSGLEVLNTVPFGGSVSPVSLKANQEQSKQLLQERHDRLDALLKDHQLQLQVKP